MADAAREKARKELRRTQADFERAQSQRDRASAARRKSFERARAAGFSMRDIGKETGLHFSRVAEILRGE
ncbi:MAG TPA: hypothetical protein VFP23_05045 [Solirubrobacterales bacterium]|nr:hypothetical protein [Solirubrobacterales bacterium]